MKKACLVLTLILSSFFIFNLEVKAYEKKVDLDFSYLNDDFYSVKSLAEEFILNDDIYSDYFIIYLLSGKLYVSYLPVYESGDLYTSCSIWSSDYIKLLFRGSLDRYKLSSSGILFKDSVLAYNQNYVWSDISYSFSFIPLFANFDIFLESGGSVTFSYDTFSFVSVAGIDNLMTLYDLKKEYDLFIGEKDLIHKEEKEVLESFYTICISKLGYLAEVIVNNYIYLSMLVILIFVFVFLLVFRRLL